MRLTRLLALAVLLLVFLSSAVEACPTCRQGLADGQHASMVRGYFWSIVFMMSMPFLIFASLASYFYIQVSRARRSAPNGISTRVGDVRSGEYGQRPTPA